MPQNETGKESVPYRMPFFYGWLMVLVSALGCLLSGPGQTYSVSVFIDSYIGEFGWSRSYVSSLYSTGTLVAGFTLLFVGKLVDARGHRVMFPIIAFCFGLACLWMGFVRTPFMLFLGFLAIRLLGQGSMSLVSSTLAPQWFVRQRGTALSFVTVGAFMGSALLPPLNTYVITNWSWQYGWWMWALLLCAFMAPLTRLLVRNRPEDVGLRPDNDQNPKEQAEELESYAEDSWTLVQARRTRTFWLLLFCMFVPSAVNTGITFHMVSIFGEQQIGAAVAAFVLSVVAVVALPSTFVAGFVLDRFPINKVIAASFVGQVLTILLLISVASPTVAIVFGILRGAVSGFEVMSFNVMWPSYFGRRHLGSIRGFSMTVGGVASAFGPLPFGIAYDLFGGYSEILWLVLVLPLCGVLCGILAVKPSKPSARRDQSDTRSVCKQSAP